MPFTHSIDALRERVTTRRNVTIYVAILVAVPVAYWFSTWTPAETGDVLLLLLLAVGVPTGFDEYKSDVDGYWSAVAWVLGASLVVTAQFVGFYVVGVDVLSLSPFRASVGSFLFVWLTNHAYLVVRSRVAA